MLTPERMAEIRECEEKATEGPYFFSDERDPDESMLGEGPPENRQYWVGGNIEGEPPVVADRMRRQDAIFIAIARSAVPELLEEVDELQAKLEQAVNFIEMFKDDNGECGYCHCTNCSNSCLRSATLRENGRIG